MYEFPPGFRMTGGQATRSTPYDASDPAYKAISFSCLDFSKEGTPYEPGTCVLDPADDRISRRQVPERTSIAGRLPELLVCSVIGRADDRDGVHNWLEGRYVHS
jgi:hypothetical protein